MKVSDAYKKAVFFLKENGVDDAEFEVSCVLDTLFSLPMNKRLTYPETEIDYNNLEVSLKRRASGEPLQYILGSWNFCGFEYKIGRGVLIPRPETELLVEKTVELIKNIKSPVIYDLCAGSGCIGLTLARLVPSSSVFLFEKSDEAISFLEENAKGIENAVVFKADIFAFDASGLDKPSVLVSNPPYIKTDEIPSLQKEVLSEPYMALDGGTDGLMFYRCISDRWLPLLEENGFAAVECGEHQAEEIMDIFSQALSNTYFVEDFNKIKRIVIGEK